MGPIPASHAVGFDDMVDSMKQAIDTLEHIHNCSDAINGGQVTAQQLIDNARFLAELQKNENGDIRKMADRLMADFMKVASCYKMTFFTPVVSYDEGSKNWVQSTATLDFSQVLQSLITGQEIAINMGSMSKSSPDFRGVSWLDGSSQSQINTRTSENKEDCHKQCERETCDATSGVHWKVGTDNNFTAFFTMDQAIKYGTFVAAANTGTAGQTFANDVKSICGW